MLRPVAPGGRCYQCTHLTLPPVWELPLLPPQPIHFPSFSCYILLPLSTPRLSPSLHILFFILVPPFCVCACTVCPGQWKALFLLFEAGEGGALSKKRVISGVRARTNNSPRPPFPPHSAESLCIKYIFCSPLHSSFFFPALPVSVRKWTPAVVAHRAVCLRHALGKARYTTHAEANKEKSRGGSSSFKKRSSVLSRFWPAWPTLFLLRLAKVVFFASLACLVGMKTTWNIDAQCITISKKKSRNST